MTPGARVGAGPPESDVFAKVLVANRGEIACRILRTLRRLDVASVAVYSEPDRASPHVDDAAEAILVDGDSPLAAYLDADRIVAAARSVGADAIHPGYGFLSERAEFAEACAAAGITFIGPTPAQLRAFGTKHGARALAVQHGVPLLPGTDVLADADAALYAAEAIGYPVMLKSTAGGGGIGMRRCDGPDELAEAFTAVERLAAAHFGTGGVLLETLRRARPPSRGADLRRRPTTSWRSASATARCSAATRRWWRRRRRRASPTRSGPRSRLRPSASVAPSATGRRARSSSCTTATARSSRSSRSTPGCRSSTASRKR